MLDVHLPHKLSTRDLETRVCHHNSRPALPLNDSGKHSCSKMFKHSRIRAAFIRVADLRRQTHEHIMLGDQ